MSCGECDTPDKAPKEGVEEEGKTPAEESSPVEEAPTEGAPAEEEAPAGETPAEEAKEEGETPAEEAPAEEPQKTGEESE